MGFQQRADAVRFLEEFKERLAKFGLELHPDKTRLIEFGRYASRDRKQHGSNLNRLRTFRHRVNRLWRNVLVRRSQTARKKWEKLTPVLERWIPPPRLLHPHPEARFYATHPS
jgi:hypothetical protein